MEEAFLYAKNISPNNKYSAAQWNVVINLDIQSMVEFSFNGQSNTNILCILNSTVVF